MPASERLALQPVGDSVRTDPPKLPTLRSRVQPKNRPDRLVSLLLLQAEGVCHDVVDHVLLNGPAEEVGIRSVGIDRHVLAAMCL